MQGLAAVLCSLIAIIASLAGGAAVPTPVELTPSSLSLVLNINETHQVPIVVRNPSNESIHNLRFTNSSPFMEIPPILAHLGAQESATLTFRFNSGDEIDQDFVTVLSFDYALSVNQQPTTYTVTINESGFSFLNLTILSGDSVTFENTGSNYHTVTEINLTSGSEDVNLSSNGAEYTLNPDRPYYLFDRNTGNTFNLFVDPRDPASLVHSASLDKNLPVSLRAIPTPVTLDVFLLTGYHVLYYDDVVEGVIRVTNPANVTAYGVNFSAPWVAFQERDINIQPRSTRVLTYNLTPANITKTNQTNRTYLLPVTATGLNVAGLNSTNLSIEAFLPWTNLSGLIIGDGFVIHRTVLGVVETLAVCKADPEYPGCEDLIRIEYKDRIKTIRDENCVPAERVEDVFNDIDKTKEAISWLSKRRDEDKLYQDDELKPALAQCIALMNQQSGQVNALVQEKEQEKEATTTKTILKWIFGILAIVVLVIWGAYRLSQRMEGHKRAFLDKEEDDD